MFTLNLKESEAFSKCNENCQVEEEMGEHVARMLRKKNSYRLFVLSPERKKPAVKTKT
jgi:hypothetical protein